MTDWDSHTQTVTMTLKAAVSGDAQAAADLLPQVYQELRNLAHYRMVRLPAGQTLQTTALVHEAYLRVIGEADPGWDGRAHFFAAAAQAMRNILVEEARKKASLKRGADAQRSELDEINLAIASPVDDVLALNEAIERLEADDPRKGQIVNMRHFAGMTHEEIAEVLGISQGTVRREWQYIKRWLFTQLRTSKSGDQAT